MFCRQNGATAGYLQPYFSNTTGILKWMGSNDGCIITREFSSPQASSKLVISPRTTAYTRSAENENALFLVRAFWSDTLPLCYLWQARLRGDRFYLLCKIMIQIKTLNSVVVQHGTKQTCVFFPGYHLVISGFFFFFWHLLPTSWSVWRSIWVKSPGLNVSTFC